MCEAGLAASKGITREGMNSSLEGEGTNSIFELGPERYRKNSNNRSVCYVVENYLQSHLAVPDFALPDPPLSRMKFPKF